MYTLYNAYCSTPTGTNLRSTRNTNDTERVMKKVPCGQSKLHKNKQILIREFELQIFHDRREVTNNSFFQTQLFNSCLYYPRLNIVILIFICLEKKIYWNLLANSDALASILVQVQSKIQFCDMIFEGTGLKCRASKIIMYGAFYIFTHGQTMQFNMKQIC